MATGTIPEQDLERLRTWPHGREQVAIDIDGRDAVVVEVQPPWAVGVRVPARRSRGCGG